ncbi:MAG: DUF4340 domain-containing protein [Planctomycetes bacterium]|nr:DUF4340 domain-containing protein [Planctomycetota bacterium]
MNNKKLIVLAITALVTTALAIWLSTAGQSPTADPTKPKYLLGNINPSLIDTIVIGTGDEPLTIKRVANRFLVKNKDNYPAKVSEINDLINKCTDIKITELYTDNPDNHKALSVLPENASSQAKFLKTDGTLLTGVIVGSEKKGGQGTYIRQAGKDEVFVTLDSPTISSEALEYIDQEITSAITRESIESVKVTQSGEIYTLTLNDQGTVLPDRMQEGKILKVDEVNKVFAALSSLRFTDVKKYTTSLDFNKSYVCRLTDQTVYNVFLVEKDDKTYLTCNALYKGQVPKKSGEFSTQEELKEKEAKYLARENAVNFFNKHSGWVYEVSSNSAKNLTMPLDDLFEEPEKPEVPEGKAPGQDPNNTEIPMPDFTM